MSERPIIHADRNIGDTVELVPASVVGQRGPWKEILRTEGDDERAQLLTLTIVGPPVYESSHAADPSEPRGPLFAEVEWGIKGARAMAEMDLPPGGLTMSLVASYVRVSARYDGLVRVNSIQLDPRATGGSKPGPRQRVGAIIGYGAYGPATRLTRTFRLDNLSPATDDGGIHPTLSPPVRVPAFARHLTVTARNLWSCSFEIRCFGPDTTTPHDIFSIPSGQHAVTVPLPGDCTGVVLGNTTTTYSLQTPALTFQLAL
jgi:hypothetical protein